MVLMTKMISNSLGEIIVFRICIGCEQIFFWFQFDKKNPHTNSNMLIHFRQEVASTTKKSPNQT